MRHYGQWCRPCLPLGRLPSLYKVRIIRRHDPISKSSYPSETLDQPFSRLAGLGFEAQPGSLVIVAGFAVYLDAVVQEKFSGKRWTIPAKVYARPLELFTGQKLSKNDFLTELDALGYRRESAANGPGAAAVNGNTVDLNTRGFQFYEGMEPAQFVRVRFSGDYVAGLSAANGKALDVVRLEPLMIGGIYPKNLEDRILIKIDQVPSTCSKHW